ncbi:hypothetical protein B0H19DRAFT_1245385 [Mycena capillaripes]|nr:hypothetical protein B0H19DRAFT_1245385 [Mycena capillaripes]
MPLRRLAIALCPLFGGSVSVDLAHPAFRSITHLDMFDAIDGLDSVWPQISTLPALTHLALHRSAPRHIPIMMTVLLECPRLELLLILWSLYAESHYASQQIPHVYDVRFVMGMYNSYIVDWEAGAKGLPDMWSRADDFVARKRRGEIKETCYWLN